MDPLLVDMTKPSAASKDLQGPQALMAPGEAFTKDDIEKIRQFPNVDHIETITSITGKSTIVYNEQSMVLSQLTTLTDSFDPALIEKGAMPADNQILLPKTAADQLSGNQAESMIGKTITLYINEMDGNHKPVTLEKN